MPGTQSYSQSVSTDTHRWAFQWCGTDRAHFLNLLAPFTIKFYVDGDQVSPSDILEYDMENNRCRVWVTLVGGWRSGDQVRLDITYHLSSPVQGGSGMRDIGYYTQRINVSVR